MRSPEARAKLAEKHPRDLDDPLDEDVEQLWVEEAVRRDAEIDCGSACVRDAEDVFREARSRLKDNPALSECSVFCTLSLLV